MTRFSTVARCWGMLEQIALIDPETWGYGPEVVNPVIREIWELHRLRAEVAALNAVVAYCGKVGDAVVMSAATETGKLVVRTAYVATLGHIANNGRLVRFVKDLLAFGGG